MANGTGKIGGEIVCGEHILAAAARGKQQQNKRTKNMNAKCRAENRVARLLCGCAYGSVATTRKFLFPCDLQVLVLGYPGGLYSGWHATFNAYKWHLSFPKADQKRAKRNSDTYIHI